MSETPQYQPEQIAKAQAKAAQIRELMNLVGGVPLGSEGALLVLDGALAAKQAELDRAYACIRALTEPLQTPLLSNQLSGIKRAVSKHADAITKARLP